MLIEWRQSECRWHGDQTGQLSVVGSLSLYVFGGMGTRQYCEDWEGAICVLWYGTRQDGWVWEDTCCYMCWVVWGPDRTVECGMVPVAVCVRRYGDQTGL